MFDSLVSSNINSDKEYTALNTHDCQRKLYHFFIQIVNTWQADQVIHEFERMFLHLSSANYSENIEALNWLLIENNEGVFQETIKRCFYILINNWNINRNHDANQQLIQAIELSIQQNKHYISPSINRLRKWLNSFIQTPDYQKIRHFAFSHTQSWTHRYESYLLNPSVLNQDISQEQQKVARQLVQKIKEKYTYDLAMYVVRSESPASSSVAQGNPTQLGKEVVTLIKKTLSTQKLISYDNQAKLFLEQATNWNYLEFKAALMNYLMLSSERQYPISYIRDKLCQKLDKLETTYSDNLMNKLMISRACQQLIQVLTTENDQAPSSCFCLFNSQGNHLTLVLVLLKLILISRSCQNYLDQKIANLIHYYQALEEQKCHKFIQFLEVFNLVFTLFTTNVQFHLVKVHPQASPTYQDLDGYRLFCQLKGPDLRQANLKTANFNNQDLKCADLRKTDLQGREFIQADLRLANLSQANLSQSVFNEARLLIANLALADLSEASLNKADLHRANLQQANLTKAHLTSAQLNYTNLSQANLTQANLMAASCKQADLRNANLSGANLEYADLSQVDLSGANLKGANLRGANLTGANLQQANLNGADLRTTNLSQTNLYQADLSSSNLYRANLTQANLKAVNFTQANLNQANLTQVDALAANFSNALLRRTRLMNASFVNAELRGCDLTRANLKNADLSGANLCSCLIRHTLLNQTNLSDTNLQGANLFGSNLQQAILNSTQFGENAGLSEHLKHYLKHALHQEMQ